jgi:putative membrane protein
MQALTTAAVLAVAALHLWFLVLEMFLWTKPFGRKAFRMSAEKARDTAVLAANQGLYNGFLAAGLIYGVVASSLEVAFAFKVFFLACVIVAGLYGTYSVSRKIFFMQAMPAIATLLLNLLC